MNKSTRIGFLVAILFMARFGWSAQPVLMYSLSHYDLDQLIYSSDVVARVEVGSSTAAATANCLLYSITPLEIFKGDLKIGQPLSVSGVDLYHRSPGIEGESDSWDPIHKGDILYVFLETSDKARVPAFTQANANWTVKESGTKLVVGSKVYSFEEYRTPKADQDWLPCSRGKAFVAMAGKLFPEVNVPTQPDFDRELRQSIIDVARIRKMLDGGYDPSRLTEALQFISGRDELMKRQHVSFDPFGQDVAIFIDHITDPQTLYRISADPQYGQLRINLELGLLHGKGPEFLLEKIDDPALPMDERLHLAERIATVGGSYARDLDDQMKGNLSGIPSDLATMLAEAAVENLGGPLGKPLLRAVSSCHRNSAMAPALIADLKSAATILENSYVNATDSSPRFSLAEAILTISPETFSRIAPGSMLTISYLYPNSDFDEGLSHSELRLRYDRMSSLPNNHGVPLTQKLVLRSLSTGNELEIPVGKKPLLLQEHSGGAFFDPIKLPADLPPGQYQLFLRIYQQDKPVSDGFGFLANIPAKK